VPGYRFCRSDDVPLLVAAYDACWVPHFAAPSAPGGRAASSGHTVSLGGAAPSGHAALTIDDFKRGVRELGFWASSCMVAFEGEEPIGVLIAAKRDGDANYVWRLAVKPGWERQGHGRHLLTSLADKAAILGPARLVVEIPAECTEVRRFFERSGFVEEARYVDWSLPAPPGGAGTDRSAGDLAVPITLDELIEAGAFDPIRRRAWIRTAASLRARAAELAGLAIATDRIEAYVLHAPSRPGPGRDVLAFGTADGSGSPFLGALLRSLADDGSPVSVRLVGDDEVSFDALGGFGFRRVGDTIGYVLARTVT
jgi:GNAT superfamily N-acetyltransferase